MIHLFLHNIYVVIGFFAIVEGPIIAVARRQLDPKQARRKSNVIGRGGHANSAR